MEAKYYPGWYKEKPTPIRKYNKYPKDYSKKYKKHLSSAKARNIETTIINEQFVEITSKPCTYCGNVSNNGIDRIDSSKGYTIENSQSCCSRCNVMKMDMTHNDFINHIQLITKYLQMNI